MKQTDTISPRQFVATAFVCVLSPLIRRFPRTLVLSAGRIAWLTVPAAVPAAALILWLFWLLFHKRPGESFSAILSDVLGGFSGKVLTALYALWLLFYTGFLLRSGAIRFLSTVYQGARPWIFVAGIAAVCALAAAGTVRAVARTAMLLRPLLAAIPALAVVLTFKDADFRMLMPVILEDPASDAMAVLKLVNLLGIVLFLSFLGDRIGAPLRVRDWAGWTGVILALVGLMTVGCLGMFGPELTARMTYPFFMLVRDVTVLGSFERVEPVIIAVWIFADFILLSLLPRIAAGNLRYCVSAGTDDPPRWLPPLCTFLAALVAFVLPEDLTVFYLLSERIVPLTSAALCFGIPLLTLIVGKLRKRL